MDYDRFFGLVIDTALVIIMVTAIIMIVALL
jgi:hypothetical protein